MQGTFEKPGPLASSVYVDKIGNEWAVSTSTPLGAWRGVPRASAQGAYQRTTSQAFTAPSKAAVAEAIDSYVDAWLIAQSGVVDEPGSWGWVVALLAVAYYADKRKGRR